MRGSFGHEYPRAAPRAPLVGDETPAGSRRAHRHRGPLRRGSRRGPACRNRVGGDQAGLARMDGDVVLGRREARLSAHRHHHCGLGGRHRGPRGRGRAGPFPRPVPRQGHRERRGEPPDRDLSGDRGTERGSPVRPRWLVRTVVHRPRHPDHLRCAIDGARDVDDLHPVRDP